MKVHELKCWPEFFEAIVRGVKTFEYRLNDRDYQVGDMLVLQEYDAKEETYSGRECTVFVPYLLKVSDELVCGHVVMSIEIKGMEL